MTFQCTLASRCNRIRFKNARKSSGDTLRRHAQHSGLTLPGEGRDKSQMATLVYCKDPWGQPPILNTSYTTKCKHIFQLYAKIINNRRLTMPEHNGGMPGVGLYAPEYVSDSVHSVPQVKGRDNPFQSDRVLLSFISQRLPFLLVLFDEAHRLIRPLQVFLGNDLL